jgi:hypothetical protein
MNNERVLAKYNTRVQVSTSNKIGINFHLLLNINRTTLFMVFQTRKNVYRVTFSNKSWGNKALGLHLFFISVTA